VDRLTSMTVFARVATTRNFSAAARQLGISQATASKHVQTLESWLGARLLNRTTRRVELTATGETFFAQCTRILEDMEAARMASHPQPVLRGAMRITAPIAFGSERLAPLVADFLHDHPEVSLSVILSDRLIDPAEEGFDLAIRTGPVNHTGLASHRLSTLNFLLVAAPEYLARQGMPGTPDDLIRHECIVDVSNSAGAWRFFGPAGPVSVTVSGRLRANNGLLQLYMARAGVGVLLAPHFLVSEDVAAGRLLPVLPAYVPAEVDLLAICPSSRAAVPKTRGLIGFLTSRLAN
jgi:DNA-binding transcriptional LysR family regulator